MLLFPTSSVWITVSDPLGSTRTTPFEIRLADIYEMFMASCHTTTICNSVTLAVDQACQLLHRVKFGHLYRDLGDGRLPFLLLNPAGDMNLDRRRVSGVRRQHASTIDDVYTWTIVLYVVSICCVAWLACLSFCICKHDPFRQRQLTGLSLFCLYLLPSLPRWHSCSGCNVGFYYYDYMTRKYLFYSKCVAADKGQRSLSDEEVRCMLPSAAQPVPAAADVDTGAAAGGSA